MLTTFPTLTSASVTDWFVTQATHIINDLGLAGIALLNCISQIIIVPGTEATMLFAGFNVYDHKFSLLWVIVFGVIGDVAGGSLCYLIGRLGIHEVLASKGLHVNPQRIEQASGWFDRFGAPVIAVSRCVPVFRSAPPYAAGIVRMPYWRFLTFAVIGSTVWIGGLALAGRAAGHDWEKWRKHLGIIDYFVVALVVIAVVYFAVRYIRNRRTPTIAS